MSYYQTGNIMKKIYLSLLALATAPVFAKTYEEVREEFRASIRSDYEKIMGPISPDGETVIDEYLADLEKLLPNSVKNDADSELARDHFVAAGEYSVAFADIYMCSGTHKNEILTTKAEAVRTAVYAAHSKERENALVDDFYKKVALLVTLGVLEVSESAARTYHAELPIKTKSSLIFHCMKSKIK